MQEIGPQYPKDDKLDPSGFLKRARLHQSRFRADILNLPFDGYGNYLSRADGENGNNFHNGFGIFEAVRKCRKYNRPLYSNMLRSEHIPFNIFVPLDCNKTFCKNIFNEFLDNTIKAVEIIVIEYAPRPIIKYLDDKTSFDTYIEYEHIDGSTGILGIEVKYTEREYNLALKSKQEKEINNNKSKYFSVTECCKLYHSEALNVLPTDKYRQMWRNQLLGESILIVDADKYKHFTSIILFPSGNSHFIKTCKEYIDLLATNEKKFIPLTYEEFFATCNKYCPDNDYREWLGYLLKRYLFNE